MRYCILTFGCRANQADSWAIERDLRLAGAVSAPADAADLVVVNTCTVTSAADQAARHAIRRTARVNPAARIVATGCYATRTPVEVSGLPGVSTIVANTVKDHLIQIVRPPAPPAAPNAAARWELRPGHRGRTAYPLRVQTGCNESCAYCIVPRTRGEGRSRPLADVLDEVRRAADSGFQEFWVSGVHLGSYGRDLRPSGTLFGLLSALDGVGAQLGATFRLSSLEPMDCRPDVLDLVAASERFAAHLHLPLQHASDRMLAAMGRPYDLAGFDALVSRFRQRLPNAALGTDLIAGFPGEELADVERQIHYLSHSALTHVHVFPYSDRPGTAASTMRGKIPAEETRRRASRLRQVADGLHADFVERQVGLERPALTLHDGTVALTDNYLRVGIAPGHARNERVRLRITSATPLRGEAVS